MLECLLWSRFMAPKLFTVTVKLLPDLFKTNKQKAIKETNKQTNNPTNKQTNKQIIIKSIYLFIFLFIYFLK